MPRRIKSIVLVGFVAFGLISTSACDQINKAAKNCTTTSESGHTELNCGPQNNQ